MADKTADKKGNNFIQYLRNTRAELPKISWPTKRETVISTIMVFVMATLMSIFLYFTDQIVAFLIRLILGL